MCVSVEGKRGTLEFPYPEWSRAQIYIEDSMRFVLRGTGTVQNFLPRLFQNTRFKEALACVVPQNQPLPSSFSR